MCFCRSVYGTVIMCFFCRWHGHCPHFRKELFGRQCLQKGGGEHLHLCRATSKCFQHFGGVARGYLRAQFRVSVTNHDCGRTHREISNVHCQASRLALYYYYFYYYCYYYNTPFLRAFLIGLISALFILNSLVVVLYYYYYSVSWKPCRDQHVSTQLNKNAMLRTRTPLFEIV